MWLCVSLIVHYIFYWSKRFNIKEENGGVSFNFNIKQFFTTSLVDLLHLSNSFIIFYWKLCLVTNKIFEEKIHEEFSNFTLLVNVANILCMSSLKLFEIAICVDRKECLKMINYQIIYIIAYGDSHSSLAHKT
jgi:hypothetical protein